MHPTKTSASRSIQSWRGWRPSRPPPRGQAPQSFILRPARTDDGRALERLAALDSARLPAGRLLVAEVEGELWAAVPLCGGTAIADPFRPTAELVELLRVRALQLAGAGGDRRTDRSGLARPAGSWRWRPRPAAFPPGS
jgi:hypothetical protein